MRLLALVTESNNVARFLRHLGEPTAHALALLTQLLQLQELDEQPARGESARAERRRCVSGRAEPLESNVASLGTVR
jgi:hypothetical protein